VAPTLVVLELMLNHQNIALDNIEQKLYAVNVKRMS